MLQEIYQTFFIYHCLDDIIKNVQSSINMSSIKHAKTIEKLQIQYKVSKLKLIDELLKEVF